MDNNVAVARLTKLADDYASRGDFATEDDLRTLLAAYADAARDREREVCELLASCWHYGDFKAETHNEREMERLMREIGLWPTSEADIVARTAARTGEAR